MLRFMAFAALAMLSSGPFAQCREVSGGRLEGLSTPVVWHARVACGGSTQLWFQSLEGEGKESAWRVDDLLILPELEPAQTLSLVAAQKVECRQRSGQSPLVFALGEWGGAGQGANRRAYRAWRLDPATRKLEEIHWRVVSCVVR